MPHARFCANPLETVAMHNERKETYRHRFHYIPPLKLRPYGGKNVCIII